MRECSLLIERLRRSFVFETEAPPILTHNHLIVFPATMSTPEELARLAAPHLPTAQPGAPPEALAAIFDQDERIHFSTVTRRWTCEDESGAEWEYESAKGAWIPVVSAIWK